MAKQDVETYFYVKKAEDGWILTIANQNNQGSRTLVAESVESLLDKITNIFCNEKLKLVPLDNS